MRWCCYFLKFKIIKGFKIWDIDFYCNEKIFKLINLLVVLLVVND